MNYYSGGLAELVSHPTLLTYSFFTHWFTGATSFGRAMSLLGLPYQKTTQPIVNLVEGQLLVNLEIEEKTLFEKTIYSYVHRQDINSPPALEINPLKAANPLNYPSTLKLVSVQSSWQKNPKKALSLAKNLLESIPTKEVNPDVSQIDELLTTEVWPRVLAITALTEFFHRILSDQSTSSELFWNQVSSEVAKRDFFFNSLSAQARVKSHEISLEEYLDDFGLRADIDYELNCPRWKEIPQYLEERLSLTKFRTDSLPIVPALKDPSPLAQVLIELQILRSDARKKTLFYINALRQVILQSVSSEEGIEDLTRDSLLGQSKMTPDSIIAVPYSQKVAVPKLYSEGQGLPVSPGQAEGVVKLIDTNTTTIAEGTIGIFPNATPEFTMQYPQCSGIIFITGGQTSHGAIVAREFGIPALLDHHAADIPTGSHLTIDGSKGTWRVL